MTMLEKAVEAAHYAIAAASSENHNVDSRAVARAVLEAIRGPDMNLILLLSRRHVVHPSVIDILWCEQIDAILGETKP